MREGTGEQSPGTDCAPVLPGSSFAHLCSHIICCQQHSAKEILLWLPIPRNSTGRKPFSNWAFLDCEVIAQHCQQTPRVAWLRLRTNWPLQEHATGIRVVQEGSPLQGVIVDKGGTKHHGFNEWLRSSSPRLGAQGLVTAWMEGSNYRNMMPADSRENGNGRPVSWTGTGYGFTGTDAVLVEDISALIRDYSALAPWNIEGYNGEIASDNWKPESSSQCTRSAFQNWQQGFASSTVRVPGTYSRDRNHWLLRECFSLLRRIPLVRNREGAKRTSNYEIDGLANEIGSDSATEPIPGFASEDEFATTHTLAERKRRKKQSDSLKMLRSILPASRKKDKASVLCSTVEYLKELETDKEQLLERRRQLESLLKRQEQEQELGGKLQSFSKGQTGM